MSASVIEVRKSVADRDTRCRNCWGRITRREPVNCDPSGVMFHSNCRPVATSFPVIGSIDADGNEVNPTSSDHSYSHYRSARRRR